MKKFLSKVKALALRGKAAVVAAVAAVSTAAVSVCASAATTEATTNNMETMMQSAGDQLTAQFGSLVTTLIPVILGILGSGLVIFGIMALIKLAKKVFGKVAG